MWMWMWMWGTWCPYGGGSLKTELDCASWFDTWYLALEDGGYLETPRSLLRAPATDEFPNHLKLWKEGGGDALRRVDLDSKEDATWVLGRHREQV